MFRLRTVALVGALLAGVCVTGSVGSVPSGASTPHLTPAPGYWLVASDGGVFSFGGAGFFGSTGGQPSASPVVGLAATPDGGGYREVERNGLVESFGDAFPESTTPGSLDAVGVAALSDRVYLEAFASGQVLEQAGTFDVFHAPLPALNAPIVGIASTTAGPYWLAAADGGVFGLDQAPFLGSMGGQPLNSPIVGIAATPDGGGYWLVAADGGVFSFGDASFYGSMGGQRLKAPVVGIASTPDGGGYWLAAADGGVFSFGDAAFMGSTGALHLNAPIVGIAAVP
jgi:hypothetical protein